MKKFKMIASAVLVFTVVGSALAFNAPKFGNGHYFCKDSVNGTCSADKDYEITGGSLTLYCATTANDCANQQSSVSTAKLIGE